MNMTASELLDALEASGTPDRTIGLGRKFARLTPGADSAALIAHLEAMAITEGTIAKARALASGAKKPADYQGVPPQSSREAHEERLGRIISEKLGEVLERTNERQSTKQAEAEAAGIGRPDKKPKATVAAH